MSGVWESRYERSADFRTRGGGAREGLRRSAAGPAVALREALSLAGPGDDLAGRAGVLRRARAGLDHQTEPRDGAWRADGWLSGASRCARRAEPLRLVGDPVCLRDPSPVRSAVRQHGADGHHRAVGHARPAPLGLRPHPVPAPRLLRQLPRRPPGDARHQRRGERRGDVLGGHRGSRHRRAEDDRVRHGAVPDPAEAGALDRCGGPAAGGGRHSVSPEGEGGLPDGPGADRPDQHGDPGDHRRDEGGAALHPGGAELPGLRRAERQPPRRLEDVDPLRRAALLGRRGGAEPDSHDHRLVRHRLRRAGHHLHLHRLDAEILHAASRSIRQVLGNAVFYGECRADLPAPGQAAGDRRPQPSPDAPRGPRSGRVGGIRPRLVQLPR